MEGLRPRPVEPAKRSVRGLLVTQMSSDSGSRQTAAAATETDERCQRETDEAVMGRDTSDGMVDTKEVKVWGKA